jgi:hypothetical protein
VREWERGECLGREGDIHRGRGREGDIHRDGRGREIGMEGETEKMREGGRREREREEGEK